MRAYEQAKELAVDLIQKWLVKYKFKNWMVHSNGTNVSLEEKKQRAYDIANKLSNNNIWKSHGRAINLEELREMNLKITDYGEDEELNCKIDGYYAVMQDYVAKYHLGVFVHTRRFFMMSIVDKIQSLNIEVDEQSDSLIEALDMYHSLIDNNVIQPRENQLNKSGMIPQIVHFNSK